MNLTKFNPKQAEQMYDEHKNYNIMLKDGTVIVGAHLEYYDDSNNYYFYSNGNIIDLKDVDSTDKWHSYGLVKVGDGWTLTKNENKVFKGNTYGVMGNHEFAQSIMFLLQSNQDTYTPDTIHERDIVEYKHPVKPDIIRKAIVTEVIKPTSPVDHGVVEIYFLDNDQYFEHITYIGWNEFMKVIEEY